ncbi:MAG TPA: hypothetical protein VLT84_02910 [Acidobacteriota bacterium]|nr:hypothetical protein [Acidobacteriota bacterium]
MGAGRLLTVIVALLAFAAPAWAQSNPYNTLTLLWTAPGDDGDVGQVSGYEIRYDTTAPSAGDTTSWWNAIPSSQWISRFGTLAPAGQTDSALATGLTQGTTYHFVLVAMDEAANRSGYSNFAFGTTQSCGAPTFAPASFAAAADTGEVLVTWSPTSDPSALSLHLYRAVGSSGSFALYQSLAPTSSSFLDTNVQPGTTYRYRAAFAGPDIQGVNCEGPTATSVPVTTPGLPGGGTSEATSGPTIHAYPNPSSGPVNVSLEVTGTRTQGVRLRLFDMSGRWIATITEGDYPPGTHLLSWPRTGRNGERVAPGYYELLGTVGGTRVRERLILLP